MTVLSLQTRPAARAGGGRAMIGLIGGLALGAVALNPLLAAARAMPEGFAELVEKTAPAVGQGSVRPVLGVADTGGGIAAEARDKVLRRYVRLDDSRTTPGSGLGLSLVAAVAARHGARLTLADNHPGLKVTLTFRAPAATG